MVILYRAVSKYMRLATHLLKVVYCGYEQLMRLAVAVGLLLRLSK